jgi:hypothetical protein
LSGSIPSEFENLVAIRMLSFYSNQLNGTLPSFFGNLMNISILLLANNSQLSGTVPSSFCRGFPINSLAGINCNGAIECPVVGCCYDPNTNLTCS